MAHSLYMLFAALLGLAVAGCGTDTPPEDMPNGDDKAAVSLTLEEATDSSLRVAAALTNADVAYVLLGDAKSVTPALHDMFKGQKLTASGSVLFEELTAGTP